MTTRHDAVVAMGLAAVAAGIAIGEPGCRRADHKTVPSAAGEPAVPVRVAASERQWSLKWTWAGPGLPLAGAPAAWKDGWVAAAANGQIVAIDGTGAVRWTHSVSNVSVVGSPAVAGSMVVIAGAEGAVAALEAETGMPVWQVDVGAGTLHGPLALRAGAAWRVVLLGHSDGVLHCLDAADGHEVWKSKPTNRSDGAPATDGRLIAYGNCDSAVHFVDAGNGAEVASVAVGADSQMAGGVVFQDGRVYGGTRTGNLVCVDPTAGGKIVWQARVARGEAFVTPATVPGSVVMGTADGQVLSFDAGTGKERWKTSVSNEVSAVSVVDDVIFLAAGGRLVGLKQADGVCFLSLPVGDKVYGPAVNGDLVAVSDDGGGIVTVSGDAGKKGTR